MSAPVGYSRRKVGASPESWLIEEGAMKLGGHAKITRRAVDDLAREERDHPIYSALGTAGLSANVVARDIIDVIVLGHWADFGQCHHFMRRFDGQSQAEAYAEAIHWIQNNAFASARTLSRQIHLFYGRGGAPAASTAPRRDSRASEVFAGGSWQVLGNALHAVQDSFAEGHAEREDPRGAIPGAINRIKRYAGHEKDGHEEADKQWWDAGARDFSVSGGFAVEATKHLLRVVVDSAMAARGDKPVVLLGFEPFRTKWLLPSPSLSKERDRVFDLIDRYYTGVRLGATNIKTVSMDEEGLAKALIAAGTDTPLVLGVFERLDENYNSDSDDVAEIYVNQVRKVRGPIEGALRSNGPLVQRLIKVMDEGWTSAGEKDCINYLRTLL